MSDDETNNTSKTKDIIDATTALVRSVPVYEDTIQPAAKVAGKSLETVARAVDAALMPLRGMVWGAEQFEDFLKTRVTIKLENTPSDDIQSPDPKIAGPALEALRYTTQEDETIQDSFANLFANAMNKKKTGILHPSFVEVMRQLNATDLKVCKLALPAVSSPAISVIEQIPKERKYRAMLKIVTLFGNELTGVSVSDIQTSIENIARLGLVDIEYGVRLSGYERQYLTIELLDDVQKVKKQIIESKEGDYDRKEFRITTTEFGRRFNLVCLAPYC